MKHTNVKGFSICIGQARSSCLGESTHRTKQTWFAKMKCIDSQLFWNISQPRNMKRIMEIARSGVEVVRRARFEMNICCLQYYTVDCNVR